MLQIALVMTAMFTSGGTTANVTVSMSINATPG
jgi:hypothetical protein